MMKGPQFCFFRYHLQWRLFFFLFLPFFFLFLPFFSVRLSQPLVAVGHPEQPFRVLSNPEQPFRGLSSTYQRFVLHPEKEDAIKIVQLLFRLEQVKNKKEPLQQQSLYVGKRVERGK